MRGFVVIVALACCALAACGSDGPGKVPRARVAHVAQAQADVMARRRGGRYPRIKCPTDLEGKKGAEMFCTVYGTEAVAVRVTATEGNRVKMRVAPDPAFLKRR